MKIPVDLVRMDFTYNHQFNVCKWRPFKTVLIMMAQLIPHNALSAEQVSIQMGLLVLKELSLCPY